jgi:hypothetical protein
VNENVFAYSNRAGDDRSLVLYNNAYSEAGGWIRAGAVAIPQKSGGFRQDSLCQALGLHGADAFFTLLREQRQELWYIRSSKEIAERGLFVSLKGYEAQVFIDIHEVEDDSRGRFARLHAELNGRGVKDVQSAIQDIYLGELYYRFTDLFKRDHIDTLLSVLRDEPVKAPSEGTAKSARSKPVTNSVSIGEFIDSLKEPVLNFITTAEQFLDGVQYDPFTTPWTFQKIKPEQTWTEFAAYMERLKTLMEYGYRTPHRDDKPAIRFLRSLGEKIIASPALAIFAYAYGILSLLRNIIGDGASGLEAKALADHWSLDRKLRECFGICGISGDETCRVLEIMKAVLARTSPAIAPPVLPTAEPVKAAGKKKAARTESAAPDQAISKTVAQALSPAETLILENYHAEDFRKLLGVNIFEDTIWFNKEAFWEVLLYAPLFIVLENGAALETVSRPPVKAAPKVNGEDWLERAATIGELSGAFAKAEAKSGYQLDGLLGALGGSGK